jgi:phosphohistidine phosphatase SixA
MKLGRGTKWFVVITALLALSAGMFVLGVYGAVHNPMARVWHKQFERAGSAERAARKLDQNKVWADRVIQGGYILHFRHAQREKWHDSSAFDSYALVKGIDAATSTFARATCLTPQGVEEARLIGEVFRMAGVKVSSVVSSPSCRARQTAQYAFGEHTVSNSLLARTGIMVEQRDDFDVELRKLLLQVPVPQGQNAVLTGHGQTFMKGKTTVLDEDRMETGGLRLETGFYVLERKDAKLIAHYRFESIREFSNAVIRLPLD